MTTHLPFVLLEHLLRHVLPERNLLPVKIFAVRRWHGRKMTASGSQAIFLLLRVSIKLLFSGRRLLRFRAQCRSGNDGSRLTSCIFLRLRVQEIEENIFANSVSECRFIAGEGRFSWFFLSRLNYRKVGCQKGGIFETNRGRGLTNLARLRCNVRPDEPSIKL